MSNYEHPTAIQRVCAEVERIAWSIDRDFAKKHRKRRHWIRPAEAIEIAEVELASGSATTSPPAGARWYVAVKAYAPGIRTRRLFWAPDIADEFRDLTEAQCRHWFDTRWVEHPQYAELDRKMEATFGRGRGR